MRMGTTSLARRLMTCVPWNKEQGPVTRDSFLDVRDISHGHEDHLNGICDVASETATSRRDLRRPFGTCDPFLWGCAWISRSILGPEEESVVPVW